MIYLCSTIQKNLNLHMNIMGVDGSLRKTDSKTI